jgi:hypothetical protein
MDYKIKCITDSNLYSCLDLDNPMNNGHYILLNTRRLYVNVRCMIDCDVMVRDKFIVEVMLNSGHERSMLAMSLQVFQ